MTFDNESFKMSCCPEDLVCKNIMNRHHSRQECCNACEMPCCQECAHHMFGEEPSMPPVALSNDMVIYYAATELYIENVTAMEMICASVCVSHL